MIFSGQSSGADNAALSAIASDLASTIDRVSAEAGSIGMVYKMPKGIDVDIDINYKSITVSSGNSEYTKSFTALTHTRDYNISSPKELCVIKNQDDMKISVSNDRCMCNPEDGRCDPGCILGTECDPDCNQDSISDNVCDMRCSKEADGICDMDCFTNDEDKVNEATDCIISFETDANGIARSTERDNVCDGDSSEVEDGICDIDCLNNRTTMDGLCDIDCNKYNMTLGNGIMVSEDFVCDLDCKHTGDIPKDGSEITDVVLDYDGVCDLDCAGPINESSGDWLDRVENGICDPDCGGLYDRDCGKCAGLGESCSDRECCGEWVGTILVCCPGEMICREDVEGFPACDGNGWCEISPYADAEDEDLEHQTVKWDPGSTHPKNWESAYTATKLSTEGYTDCSDAADGICYSESQSYTLTDHPPAAYYYLMGNGYSDPDCEGDGNGCQWMNQMSVGAGDTSDCNGIIAGSQNADDDWCSITANDECDPDCGDIATSKRWDPDCGEPDCDAKVNKGLWTMSVYGSPEGTDNYVWVGDAIEVCNEDVIAFLDRRGWDINQFMLSIQAHAPDGWGFDFSRYGTEVGEYIQPASLTVTANDNYMATNDACCPTTVCYGTCGEGGVAMDENCCGVGFCGDHSTAVTSVLRTLGVPANNIWSSHFKRENGGHAWNVLYCNRSIENLGKYGNYNMYQSDFILDFCVGHENEWILIDATNHRIRPLSEARNEENCNNMEDMWNDHGRYGFQGIVCDDQEIEVADDTCEISDDGSVATCDCPWCGSDSVCVINHPLAGTEDCNVNSDNDVECPFRKNLMETGDSMGC